MENNRNIKHPKRKGQQLSEFPSKQNSNHGIIQVGNVYPTKTRENPNQGRVYSAEGIAPCLTNLTGGVTEYR